MIAAALAVGGSGSLNGTLLGQNAPAGAVLAQVNQLKAEAAAAAKAGQFEKVQQLIDQAASLSQDPQLTNLKGYLSSFADQRREFMAARKKSYDQAVERAHKLVGMDKLAYALSAAVDARSYTDDKNAFHNEAWVIDLINRARQLALQHEADQQWIKALQIYSNLAALEPQNPTWSEHQKATNRRLRLIGMYTPDAQKAAIAALAKEREEVDKLVNPATQPSTAPSANAADKKDDDAASEFRIDWKELLAGVKMDMLREAVDNARNNYWRDIGYDTLMNGGLKGLNAVATTKGLDAAFPGLADAAKVAAFKKVIDDETAALANNGPRDRAAMQRLLTRLQVENRRTVELPEEVLVSEFADAAFAELDPFSNLMWPYDLEEFAKSTQGEFSGVGIQIGTDPDGTLKVVSPLEDSPAFRAKIKPGDLITHVNGKNVKGITTTQAVKIITGPVGTQVKLTIKSPDGQVKDYTLTRQKIKVESVKGWLHLPGGGWDYFIDEQNKIAYLRLIQFQKETSADLTRALAALRRDGAKGIVLDLRYNPGGLLQSAAEVSDSFLGDGTIVSTKSDRGDDPSQPPLIAHKAASDVDLPMVVLVNQFSASASEIVSGALRDHKRALIVGERTFGKGSVQMVFPLSARQAYLKLTTSHYYLPNGKCIHREETSTEWGVEPHVTVEMSPNQMNAVIDARRDLDVLRDANDPAAQAVGGDQTKKLEQSLLSSDPQLTAALLLLRMQLAGAPVM
jgi:carboxyl-terminal processing protease